MLRGKMLKVRQQYLREMEERNYEGTYVQCPTVPTGHLYVNGGLIEYAYNYLSLDLTKETIRENYRNSSPFTV